VYLKKYEVFKEIGAGNAWKRFGPPRGLSETDIVQMEQEMNNGKTFPKAYREFLFLGGEFSTIQLNHYGKHTPKGTEKFRQGLKKRKINMVRPFAMISVLDGECGTFIYLDEGDNPKPYNCSIDKAYDSDDDEIIWDSPFNTFSQMIDEHIYLAENNLGV
jgi:restriction endonuclease S subunit